MMGFDGLCFVFLLLLAQGFQVAQGECDLSISKLFAITISADWRLEIFNVWDFVNGMLSTTKFEAFFYFFFVA